ncbi:MAG: hypothetical protein LBC84_03445 [Prevotellaceae bacterium]|jgi:V/A-type H+-transporting ATPase subunit E|nr:hypothetical protein [Prevotellaceae bacterium]
MQTKLQELTDKLYQEGLSKGTQEGLELLEKAKKEADTILRNARAKSDSMMEEARKQISEQHTNAQNELKMAAQQSLAKLKLEIESLVLTKIIQPPVHQAVSDVDFVKTLIKTALESFDPKSIENASLHLLLPASMQKELDQYLSTQLHKKLSDNLIVSFDPKQKTGFSIASKEGGFQLRFSDADFEALFAEYLRPKTKALLFG